MTRHWAVTVGTPASPVRSPHRLARFHFPEREHPMTAEQKLVDAGLRAWKSNVDRIDTFFDGLSDQQLQQEIAPRRNRLIYLWGHLAAANDGLFPLLRLGPKL